MMGFKKSVFSYLIWLVYTIITGLILLAVETKACETAGLESYMGIVFAVVCVAVAGGMTFLLHKFAVRQEVLLKEKATHFTVLGVVLAVALLGVGLFLRVQEIGRNEYVSSMYYEAAKVMEGQNIPQSVHGAVYFYVWLLRGFFLLLGNYEVIGIWVQIALQFAGFLLLFLLVRKFAGMLAGLVALSFCMLGPFMVRSSMVLSPDMLYFLLGMAVVWFMTLAYVPEKLNLVVCFFMGVLAALCCYIDIVGILLLLVAFGGIFCYREETVSARRKVGAVLLCVAGAIQGFGACIFLDAWLSGKPVQRVIRAWISLYQPEHFSMPVEVGISTSVLESCLLFGIMAFGIFSFWLDKKKEQASMAVMIICAIVAGSCFGIFTVEMPGFYFLYVAFAVLAGVGVGQCLQVSPAVPVKEESMIEEKGDFEILMEGVEEEENTTSQDKPIQFLENPLPLPKKHVKRVMDYTLSPVSQEDDFDYPVAEDDDFDL